MASFEHHLGLPTDGYPRITPSSPIRDLGPGCMDYERCAALHSELISRTIRACGGELPAAPPSWWEARAPSKEIASTLHPSLIDFLKRARDEDVLQLQDKQDESPIPVSLCFFISALLYPEGLFEDEDRFSLYEEPGRYLKLHHISNFRCLDDEGLLFDQQTLKASFIEDYNDTRSVTNHKWSWMPLEVILDSYLQMIDEGKVEVASEDEVDRGFTLGVINPWVIRQYTKIDLERATTAFKRLIEAIHSRIEENDIDIDIDIDKDKDEPTPMTLLPWHDPATFNNDIIPPSSFTHEFLTAISACKVRCRYIAPGIRFPTVGEFKDQPITNYVTSPHRHRGQFPGNCPFRLVQIDAEKPVARDWWIGLNNLAPGFYIHPVVNRWPQFWSNSCRLLLPFGIGGQGWARQSNGEPLGINDYWYEEVELRDDQGSLYQPGMTNRITACRAARIDKVLSNWAERVQGEDWG
ncbi:hypothetical protein BJX70DRAFT_84565 [Aspergillus crustosus]